MDKKVVTKAKDACVLGKSWFLNHVIEDKPIARIAGKEVPLDDAIDEDTISLEDTEDNVDVIDDEVDDLGIEQENTENIEE